MTTIELVRHARAHRRGQWADGPDRERPLTEEGWEEARALALVLSEGGQLDAVRSSPYLRCSQTVEPVAEKAGVPVDTCEALGEASGVPVHDGGDVWVGAGWLGGRALAVLDRLVAAYPHGRAVVCSHGDVIPAVLAVLAGRDGLDLGDVRLSKGGWMTLHFDGPRCVSVERHEALLLHR